MNKHLIIVAGGSGQRMGSTVPKQFLLLAGQPILAHTLQAFFDYDPQMNTVVVLPQEHLSTWQNLVQKYSIAPPHSLAAGGSTRTQSVAHALQTLGGTGVVAIHDAVRPLVSRATIEQCFAQALIAGACIPIRPITDALRRIKGQENTAQNKEDFFTVQTPQVFDLQKIKRAYSQIGNTPYADDAAVMENAGYPISTVMGNAENIKITTPFDLKWAEILWALQS